MHLRSFSSVMFLISILLMLTMISCGGGRQGAGSSGSLNEAAAKNPHTSSAAASVNPLEALPQYPKTLEQRMDACQKSFALNAGVAGAASPNIGSTNCGWVRQEIVANFYPGLSIATLNKMRSIQDQIVSVDPGMNPVFVPQVPAGPESTHALDYHSLAAHIAQRSGLTLKNELYFSTANSVVYLLPPGQDEMTTSLSVLQQYSDIIYMVEPNYLLTPASYFPRARDKKCDHLSQVGDEAFPRKSGCEPAFNGSQYWNAGGTAATCESYGYFQCNAHRMHSSSFGASVAPTGHVIGNGALAAAFVADSGAYAGDPQLGTTDNPDLPTVSTSAGWPYDQGVGPALNMPTDPSNTDPAYWDTSGAGTVRFVDALSADDPLYPNTRYHGTKVCGIIGARQGLVGAQEDGGIIGMIPFGKVWPFKIAGFDDPDTPTNEYRGTSHTLSLAIVRAYAIRNTARAYVINVSYGFRLTGPVSPADLGNAVAVVHQDPKFAIVASAMNRTATTPAEPVYIFDPGNPGDCHGWFPAAFAAYQGFEHVISVMSINKSGSRSAFSNWADPSQPLSVTVSAPGGDDNQYILSTAGPGEGNYGKFSGTSCAAPYVTGLVALLDSFSSATAQQLRLHLTQTADFGSGLVKPKLNCDQAMTWIDLTKPANNVDWGIPVTLTSTLEANLKLSAGQFGHNLSTSFVEFWANDLNGGPPILLGTVQSSQYTNDFAYNSQKATLNINLADYSGSLSGNIEVFAVVFVQGNLTGIQAVQSHSVPCLFP